MRRTPFSVYQPTSQRGASLIEVLITVLILAIGLLGLSALQLTSLKNNQSAMQRSVAVLQSYTIVEAIRADTDAAKKGAFNIDFGKQTGSNTSSDSFAATVHEVWLTQLGTTLGSEAQGQVSCTLKQCTITVRWNDKASQKDEQSAASTNNPDVREVITEVSLL